MAGTVADVFLVGAVEGVSGAIRPPAEAGAIESIESSPLADRGAALRDDELAPAVIEFCRSVPLRLTEEKDESAGSSGKPP